MIAPPNIAPKRPRPHNGAQLLAPNLFSRGVNSAVLVMVSCMISVGIAAIRHGAELTSREYSPISRAVGSRLVVVERVAIYCRVR